MADRDQFEEREQVVALACTVCETMLPEAVDGTLLAAEQRAFDKHLASCMQCSRELAEAQRGAAWLGMLKTQSPEPPAGLLARILAETTGSAQALPRALPVLTRPLWQPVARPVVVPAPVPLGWSGSWAAVRQQMRGTFSIENARATFQPRMAMTAAMAFFSVALTLNLTGVRLSNLRASSFTPAALQRTAAEAGASATRMFQNNRAVYQVESRLSELRSDDAPGPDASPAHR